MGRAAAWVTAPGRGLVETAGVRAAETLRHGRRGRVVAAFRRSAYLAFAETGEALVSLGAADFPKGPINVSTTLTAFDAIAPGMPALGDGACIRLGDAALLHLDPARIGIWRPAPARSWTPDAVARGLLALQGRGSGQGSMFVAAEGGGAVIDDFLRLRAAAGVDALSAWLSGNASGDAPVRKAVEALLGLGKGLTPAGDDYLSGALIALAEIGDARRFAVLASVVGHMAPGRTGRVSVAHLLAATEGMAAEPLHCIVRALLAGGEELDAALAALDAVGHSSGRDALAGALTVLESVAFGSASRNCRRTSWRGRPSTGSAA